MTTITKQKGMLEAILNNMDGLTDADEIFITAISREMAKPGYSGLNENAIAKLRFIFNKVEQETTRNKNKVEFETSLDLYFEKGYVKSSHAALLIGCHERDVLERLGKPSVIIVIGDHEAKLYHSTLVEAFVSKGACVECAG